MMRRKERNGKLGRRSKGHGRNGKKEMERSDTINKNTIIEKEKKKRKGKEEETNKDNLRRRCERKNNKE